VQIEADAPDGDRGVRTISLQLNRGEKSATCTVANSNLPGLDIASNASRSQREAATSVDPPLVGDRGELTILYSVVLGASCPKMIP
jgi:hypothetical protein